MRKGRNSLVVSVKGNSFLPVRGVRQAILDRPVRPS
jgi:hypothetical protein